MTSYTTLDESDVPLEPLRGMSRHSRKNIEKLQLYVIKKRIFPAQLQRRKKHFHMSMSVPEIAPERRKRLFPDISRTKWEDWRWQMAHRFRNADSLACFLNLSEEELYGLAGLNEKAGPVPVAVTPYYATLLDPQDPQQPLRRCMVPTAAELQFSPGESADPLDEIRDTPVPGIVHRYQDRALFLVASECGSYCRYCTRSRLAGRAGNAAISRDQWRRGIEYIAATPAIRDVLLSGGDPLTLPDEALNWLLTELRRIPHLEMVRIGSKTPAVLPMRITPGLVKMLRTHHPLWMSLHFTHPTELTPECVRACERLADAGIPLGSQTVLLNGVNDDVATLKHLFQGLLRARVRPYYLYQCDPIKGSAHFRTPVERGLECISGLRGHTTGYAVPTYVIDAPGGGGKIPLFPQSIAGSSPEGLLLRNHNGNTYLYPEAAPQRPAGAVSDNSTQVADFPSRH